MPVVMATLMLMLIFLATAGTRATIGLGVSKRDVASKRALQTAKSGLRVAIYRMNAVGLDLNQLLKPAQQCLVRVNGGQRLQSLTGEWCPAVTEDLGTGASYSYRVSSVVTTPPRGGLLTIGTTNHTLKRRIVSTGTADGVTRRVYGEITADGEITVTRVLLVNLISSGKLQAYRLERGSFRECTSKPTNSSPSSGC